MTNYKITAIAPTQYQLSALKSFEMPVDRLKYGGYFAEKFFDTEEEAKIHLFSLVSENFESETKQNNANKHINLYGRLTIDGVTARIMEVSNEEL